LDEIRNLVGIDQEHIDGSIKSAISEGKSKIDELTEKLNESYKENEGLLNKIKSIEAKDLLEEKTKGMSSSKKEFVYKLLNDKEGSYIEENFNYVVEMFERSEEETATELVKEAKQKAQTLDAKVPSTKSLVSESKETAETGNRLVNEYLSELNRK
jgi:predicted nuclease with TOPRIM domain